MIGTSDTHMFRGRGYQASFPDTSISLSYSWRGAFKEALHCFAEGREGGGCYHGVVVVELFNHLLFALLYSRLLSFVVKWLVHCTVVLWSG